MLIRHPNSARGNGLYETPEVATLALLRAEPLPRAISEPACDPSAIVRLLRDAGHRVIATDLIDYRSPDQDHAGRDFLLERRAPDGVEMIVTNPRYKLAAQFAAHALSLYPRVAMLLRLSFLEAGNEKTKAGRARLFALDSGQLARVHVFRNRLPMMHRDGWGGNRASNAVAFAWYVWERGYIGRPEIDAFRGSGTGHDHAPPRRSPCIRAAPFDPPPQSSSFRRRSSPWRHAEGRGAAPPIRKWPPTPVTELRTKCRRARRCARHCQRVRRPGRRRFVSQLTGPDVEVCRMTDKPDLKLIEAAASDDPSDLSRLRINSGDAGNHRRQETADDRAGAQTAPAGFCPRSSQSCITGKRSPSSNSRTTARPTSSISVRCPSCEGECFFATLFTAISRTGVLFMWPVKCADAGRQDPRMAHVGSHGGPARHEKLGARQVQHGSAALRDF